MSEQAENAKQVESARAVSEWTVSEWIGKLVRGTFWCAATVAVVGLLFYNGVMARRLSTLRKPLGELQTAHKQQLATIAEYYETTCLQLQQRSEQVQKERDQIRSMLEHCRSREDFVVQSGERIVVCKNFYDSRQREPAAFFYLPAGKHRLMFTSADFPSRQDLSKFMFKRDISDDEFESIDLVGDTVYEIRFHKITPDAPAPAGFQLIGPGLDGADKVIAERTLPFPAPVITVAGGYGESRLNRLPDQSQANSSWLNEGVVIARTLVVQQTFRFPTTATGADWPGPQGGVRFFVESEGPPNAVTSRALDELVRFMRQPESPATNTNDLFFRAGGFKQLFLEAHQNTNGAR